MAAGGGTFALTRTPSAALAPWQEAGSGYQDPRMRALSYAILAPNPAYPIHPYGMVIAGADIRHVKLLPGVDFFAGL